MSGFPKKFGYNGCQFVIGGHPCGETQTLEIIQPFKELYEDKLQQIEDSGGSNYLQAKVNLQQQWISDLTQQNEMLVRAVEELEHEAIDRVAMLEERLRNSAQSNSDKLVYLQSDVINLLEFIRRVRDDGKWNINGLQFYNVKGEDLFGEPIPSIEDRKIETQEEEVQNTLRVTVEITENKETCCKCSSGDYDNFVVDCSDSKKFNFSYFQDKKP